MSLLQCSMVLATSRRTGKSGRPLYGSFLPDMCRHDDGLRTHAPPFIDVCGGEWVRLGGRQNLCHDFWWSRMIHLAKMKNQRPFDSRCIVQKILNSRAVVAHGRFRIATRGREIRHRPAKAKAHDSHRARAFRPSPQKVDPCLHIRYSDVVVEIGVIGECLLAADLVVAEIDIALEAPEDVESKDDIALFGEAPGDLADWLIDPERSRGSSRFPVRAVPPRHTKIRRMCPHLEQ